MREARRRAERAGIMGGVLGSPHKGGLQGGSRGAIGNGDVSSLEVDPNLDWSSVGGQESHVRSLHEVPNPETPRSPFPPR